MRYAASKVKRLVSAISLLLLSPWLAGGMVLRAQAVQHQQWTTEDGLPQDSVHQIFQSREGYLWVATEGGVARFDGISFFVLRGQSDHAFASDDTCCIAQTADGTLWFGTADGLVRYRSGSSQRLAVPQGLASNTIIALAAADDGSLLVLTAAGMDRVRGNRAETLAPPDGAEATSLSAAPDGSVLVLAGERLLRYSHGAFAPERRSVPAQTVAAKQAGDGHLWLRSRNAVFETKAGLPVREWRAGRELSGSRIESLTLQDGEAFAGTNRGVFRIDEASGKVTALPQIGASAVLAGLVDAEGDRWFGTETSGLHVLRERAVGTLPQLADEVLTTVTQTKDGTIWLGTRDDGLRMVNPGSVTTPAVSARLASQVVLALAAGIDRDVWVGTPDGLDHVHGAQMDRYTSSIGLPDDFVRSLLAESDGSVWVGTRRGIAQLRAGKVLQTLTRGNGLRSELVGSILRSRDGDLWFGTLDGLARLRGGQVSVFTTGDGLAGNTITALAEDAAGTLWVGTRQGGLSRLQGGGRFLSFRDPALRDEIDAIVPDNLGTLWLRTRQGMVRATLADLNRCSGQSSCTLPLRIFGVADGMPSVEIAGSGHPSAMVTTAGELWFTTRKGVAVVNPRTLSHNRTPPPIVIESFEVDGRAQASGHSVQVSAGQHRFQFNYAGLSLLAPARVRYRYRLQGFDADWTEAEDRRSADYTNLPPGQYRFMVEATNSDGVRSSAPAEIAFTVRPPFYRRWWFAVLVLFVAGAVVYALYQLRLRRVRREFAVTLAERNRIAREIHDTLAQDFVGVSLQLEITAQLLKAQALEAARDQIDATRTLVRNGIRDARESIWALRANTATDSLPARLRAATDRLRGKTLEVRLSIEGVYRAMPEETEREVLRIAMEALQNVQKHAAAGEVDVRLRYEEEAVVVQVCDNGRGFDLWSAGALAGHYGLRGMRERAAGIGATLDVRSDGGQGTRLTLRLPARGERKG